MHLFQYTDHAERALDRVETAAVPIDMYFEPSKCKVLLQDWTNLVPIVVQGEE